jgi:hypothetical protein
MPGYCVAQRTDNEDLLRTFKILAEKKSPTERRGFF